MKRHAGREQLSRLTVMVDIPGLANSVQHNCHRCVSLTLEFHQNCINTPLGPCRLSSNAVEPIRYFSSGVLAWGAR